MNYTCTYDNLTEQYTCELPDNFSVISKDINTIELVDQNTNESFFINQTITYGDLMISFFLVLFFLVYFFKSIASFFFPDTIRIKKYEL